MPKDETPATDTAGNAPTTPGRRTPQPAPTAPATHAGRRPDAPAGPGAGRPCGAVALEGAAARRAAGRRILAAVVLVAAGGRPGFRHGALRPKDPAAAGRSRRRWRRFPPAAASASARGRRGCSKAPPWAPTRSSARSPPPPRATSTPWCWAPAPAVLPGSRLASLKGSTLLELAKATPASGTPRRRRQARTPVPLAGVVSQRGVDDVSVLSADAQADRQASAGAVMRYAAEDGDLRGSAAAACQQPANDLWLVGANTALGRTAVLNLSNASSSPATVSLELFGAEGQIQAPGQPRAPGGAGHHPLDHPGRARPGTGAAQRPGAQRRRARWPPSSSRACCGVSPPAASSSSPRPPLRPSAR